ncbi:hypothetical protein D3C85_1699260 [compost metagenome]
MAEKYPSAILLLQVADIFAKSGDYSGAIKYAEQATALASSSGDGEQSEIARIKADTYKSMVDSLDTDKSGNSRGQRVPSE